MVDAKSGLTANAPKAGIRAISGNRPATSGFFKVVPRFHLNLFNDIDSLDEEGRDYEDLAAAKAAAIVGARSLMASHVALGMPLNLSHRMEVTDHTGKILAVIPFREMITVTD